MTQPEYSDQEKHWSLPTPAPIKPSADTGELRDDVLERLRTLDFVGHYDEARFQYIADTILDLIESERGKS